MPFFGAGIITIPAVGFNHIVVNTISFVLYYCIGSFFILCSVMSAEDPMIVSIISEINDGKSQRKKYGTQLVFIFFVICSWKLRRQFQRRMKKIEAKHFADRPAYIYKYITCRSWCWTYINGMVHMLGVVTHVQYYIYYLWYIVNYNKKRNNK